MKKDGKLMSNYWSQDQGSDNMKWVVATVLWIILTALVVRAIGQ